MSGVRESFPREARLTRRSEFLLLSRKGRKFYTPHFIIIRRDNDHLGKRLGVTVSSKVGNAVVRNRVKRGLREFFRRGRENFRSDQDTVIIARRGAGELSYSAMTAELRKAIGPGLQRHTGTQSR
ncbi:MAG: ribonuclease P protein component [Chloroflexi bacterium]|nr:ribonuclease P protein component [Deltaproteobacteria bacterium]MDE0355551.1 ribonuclease P protein component [Deltaproteobacteria bacterium]MYI82731.1 ribonuclease P protein component [Chloroflexota bacterium]